MNKQNLIFLGIGIVVAYFIFKPKKEALLYIQKGQDDTPTKAIFG